MRLISCNSNPLLAQNIATYLKEPLSPVVLSRFADREISLEIRDAVRGEDVFVIQSTSCPVNDHIMELLITLDALKRSAAHRITAVIPYLGYMRQDRKSTPSSAISAKLLADLLTVAGAHRLLTCDLHAGQIEGFFNIPVNNLSSAPIFINDIKSHFANEPFIVVSPDIGGVVRARLLANQLGVELAIVDKRRERPGVSEVMNIIGEVKGKRCILIDDIVDSAGTLCNAAMELAQAGALDVVAYVSHGVFSGKAVERIMASPLSAIIAGDSIQANESLLACPKIRYISFAASLAEAIKCISQERRA